MILSFQYEINGDLNSPDCWGHFETAKNDVKTDDFWGVGNGQGQNLQGDSHVAKLFTYMDISQIIYAK